jgi:hypothetical protein
MIVKLRRVIIATDSGTQAPTCQNPKISAQSSWTGQPQEHDHSEVRSTSA